MTTLEALTNAYSQQIALVRVRMDQFGWEMWHSLPDYRDKAVDALVDAVTPMVAAGQIQVAELTRSYIAMIAQEYGYETALGAVDEGAVTNLRGVDPDVVYRRPANTVYTRLSEGADIAQAKQSGGLRLLQLIGTDMQMAKRAQFHQSAKQAGFQNYRRVLHGNKNCALCVVASTQRYLVDHVAPIHPACDCGFEPLPRGFYEQVLDGDLLERAHGLVEEHLGVSDRGARSPDYRKIMFDQKNGTYTINDTIAVKVREHGEYGPTLTWGDQNFTGPKSL